jgi:hypothetical protein
MIAGHASKSSANLHLTPKHNPKTTFIATLRVAILPKFRSTFIIIIIIIMKFQLLFLSLLTTTTHAQYEPKGLRGGDDHDLELKLKNTSIPKGGSARIECSSVGGQCCIKSDDDSNSNVNAYGPSCWGCSTQHAALASGKCPDGFLPVTNDYTFHCQSDNGCAYSCNGCSVSMQGGKGGAGNKGKKGRNGNSGKFYASFLQLHLPPIHFPTLTPTLPATATNLTGGMGGNDGGGGGGGDDGDDYYLLEE